MFSGIITEVGTISFIKRIGNNIRYKVLFSPDFGKGLINGASVSVDGVCQTVVAYENASATFDAIEETLRCSTVAFFKEGDKVNLERALSFGSEVGGHLVSGHVMGLANLIEIKGNTWTLKAPPPAIQYLFPKGFIALNGISLTLGEVDMKKETFSIHLIPETLAKTNLSYKAEGDYLNLEPDEMTKVIVETLKRTSLG